MFRFSLRTLFVLTTCVALLLGWVMWNVDWMRARRATIDSGRVAAGDGPYWLPGADEAAPGALGWFGEPGYAFIEVQFAGRPSQQLTADDEVEVERVARLFPEAIVVGRIVDSGMMVGSVRPRIIVEETDPPQRLGIAVE